MRPLPFEKALLAMGKSREDMEDAAHRTLAFIADEYVAAPDDERLRELFVVAMHQRGLESFTTSSGVVLKPRFEVVLKKFNRKLVQQWLASEGFDPVANRPNVVRAVKRCVISGKHIPKEIQTLLRFSVREERPAPNVDPV